MTEEKTKKLFNRFSFFNPINPLSQSLMAFGFECEDGWFDLIWRLCADIEKMLPQMINIPEEPFEVVQVKEKFGTLRFYTTTGTQEIRKRINQAEQESAGICELCGAPGKQYEIRGWLMVRCERCV